ncbi:kinesin-related protein 4-like [Mercenaria mercenaria]|uniref:kinesin-related protein 4-like n=1 Tax=Mercenaria mercenaria TaxID=6596 RepID=UPI00234E5AEF|nr:kinesin-related protein 4-like [Mercenaria mercenaria]
MAYLEDIKDFPGYKVILKAVLRSQIQQLVDQLAAETDEESVVLTANVTDKTLCQLGSNYGKMFLTTYADVKQQFLGFCLHGHESCSSISGLQVNQTTSSDSQPCENKKPKTSRNSKKRKKYSRYGTKPRYTPYQNKHTQPDDPGTLSEEISDLILKKTKDCKTDAAHESNTEAENSNNSASDLNSEISNFSGNITTGNVRISCSKRSNKEEESVSHSRSYNERCNVKQKSKEVTDDVSHTQAPNDVLEKNSECNIDDNIDYNRVTDKCSAVSSGGLESFDESRQEVSGVSANLEENGAVRIFRGISETYSGVLEIGGNFPFGKTTKFEIKDGPPDIVSDAHNITNQSQESLQSKHAIFTKDTTCDSADDEDDDNVSERSCQSQKVSQTNINEGSIDDSNEEDEDDQCSKEDSIKDYLSDEESKLDTINVKLDDDGEQMSKQNNSCTKTIKDEKETRAESIEVMQVCHQTMDQITHCVARAISEERKEKIATLEIHPKGISEIHNEEQSRSSESDGNMENVSVDEPDGTNTNNEDTNDSVQTSEDAADAGDEELHDKSYKVLAIWNEIANDTNNASSEVLYDLIADKLKQDRQKKKSVDRDSQTEILKCNTANINKVEQTEVSVDRNDDVRSKAMGIGETSYGRESESFKQSECFEDSIQTDQETVDRGSEHSSEKSLMWDVRQSSSEGDSNKRSRQNSVTQTNENVDRNISRQSSCDKQVTVTSNQTRTEGSRETVVENEIKISNESEPKTNIDKKANVPVVIDTNHTKTTKSSTLNTPVKQVGSRVTGANTPKQVKTQTPNVNKQKVQSVTPGKQGRSLVDNLISTGVPIIIPDDDDDEEEIDETDDFMPSPRSTAFEMKSKQYREQQEMRSAKRITQVAQRQGYGTYITQAASQMPQSNFASKQSYSQYPSQLQQQQYEYQEYQDRVQYRNQQYLQEQYAYQEYHDQQQYGNQQVATQQMYPSQQASSQLRQQLFTPPKNISGASSTRGRPVKSLPSPVREMSPQSHNFSPPQTPTTPKGSPYFKQGYMTPTKHQQNIQSPQTRINPNQSPAQKVSLQQNRSSSIAKPNIPSGTTIVIEDEPVALKRKLPTSVITPQHQQQSMQKQVYLLKSPVANPQQQQQHSVQRHSAESVPKSYMDLLRLQQQTASGLDNRPLKAGTGTLPVISNVASIPAPNRDNMTGAQIQQAEYRQLAPKPIPDFDATAVRQTNEKTPIKRSRSDDTVTSPSMVVTEPANKRRHTSEENTRKSQHADVKPLEMTSVPVQGQSNVEGQISPSKMPPKLEIDIDDVRGVLPEPGNQLTSLKSPPMSSKLSEISEEKPVIPIATQLARSDLKSFSPPVSPSTKRLHATPGTRSKTTAGTPTYSTQSSSDDSSVTSQEAPSQPIKKFGCGDCGKSYTTKAALNQHFRKHTQERPFECDVCGKHYSQKGYLKKHIRTHFSEK